MKIYLGEWRKYRGFVQEELAEKAGLEQATISRIEIKGRASINSIKKLSAALRCTPEELCSPPPVKGGESFDLRAWLNDPNAELTEGVKPTDAQKKIIEAVFWEIYNREQGKK